MTEIDPDGAGAAEAVNDRPYSVSELAFALKRTVESAYGFVRLRGELSKVTFHGNGHVYLDIKDEKASIAGVIWKPQVRGLAVRPETGLEVIVTGRLTTYPGRSQYQIIIETVSPAGVGALLAQLERLKAKLAEEGLFEAARKRPLPAYPRVIGVVTSPTGAVIRDILHRLSERWPCRVLVWPAVVQGDQAAAQVSAGIKGLAALPVDGPAPRPDLIIVARGGGSVEDLWPFNDETLARTVAACQVPLISAVGHETDTTLIDFVSDRRAPTPTAAAELATPVRAELMAALESRTRRLADQAHRRIDRGRARLAQAGGRLPRPQDTLMLATQRLDMASAGLSRALRAHLTTHAQALGTALVRLRPALLERRLGEANRRLEALTPRLARAGRLSLNAAQTRLIHLAQMHASLDPKAPLRRGFALVTDAQGRLVRAAASLSPGQMVGLEFGDGETHAVVAGAAPPPRPRTAAPPDMADLKGRQGSLF